MSTTTYVFICILVILVGFFTQWVLRKLALRKDFDRAMREQMGDTWYEKTRNKLKDEHDKNN